MNGSVYVNGEFYSADKPAVVVNDRGFLYGDGVFESISCWRGVIFKLGAHLVRLRRSVRASGLNLTLSNDEIGQIVVRTIQHSGLRDANVRLFITRGLAGNLAADPRDHEVTVMAWAAPYYYLAADEVQRTGARIALSPYRGLSPETLDPQYKSLNRLHFQLGRLEAFAAGYDDALLLSHLGFVAETWAANIFMIRDGTLDTPACHILPGITRRTIIELAHQEGLHVRERDFTIHELFSADEVFLTSTAGGVLPVREIAGRELPSPVPGPATGRLSEKYWALRESGFEGTPVYETDALTPHDNSVVNQ